MNVLILGGDGYLGWPTAMDFAAAGHNVTVVDNYLRRQIAEATDSDPLMYTPNLSERSKIFQGISDKAMQVRMATCLTPALCSR